MSNNPVLIKIIGIFLIMISTLWLGSCNNQIGIKDMQVSPSNEIIHEYGYIGGGKENLAGNLSTVGGGMNNHAEGIRATIGGGSNNYASRNNTVIAGGFGNTASRSFATIGGGNENMADGSYSTISGGSGNQGIAQHTTIGGGTRNRAESAYTTVGGGSYNRAAGGTSTICGGTGNQAPGIGSAIAGGSGNKATGMQSTITGGLGNVVTDDYGVIAGGRANIAGNENSDFDDAAYASVCGGYGNQAGGAYSSVLGGYGNQSLGNYSISAGNSAKISSDHHGVFLFSDSSEFPFKSSVPNEFAVRATGGVRFITALSNDGTPISGVRLTKGSGAWEMLSNRNSKVNIIPVDGYQVLETLVSIPVSTWQYIGEDEAIQHMGPMAQDFHTAFGLGNDDQYIGSIDADGVAFASIQGLYTIIQKQDSEINLLESEISKQETRLNNLEKRLMKVEKSNHQSFSMFTNCWTEIVSIFIGLMLGFHLQGRNRMDGALTQRRQQ